MTWQRTLLGGVAAACLLAGPTPAPAQVTSGTATPAAPAPTAAFPVLSAAPPAPGQDADPAEIVAGQYAVAGNHKGVRASGAKGVCLKGTFTPTPEAAALSKAPQFREPVPMVARFSMGGSNPNVSDKTKPATRGFAMRMNHPGGDLVFVVVSAPVFSTRTPQQLLDFLKVRVPGPDGKVDAAKVQAFTAANPETARQAAWLNARPVPASYAGVTYWGVQAYTLTNAGGQNQVVKLRFVPTAGEVGLTDDELKAKPDSFYADELRERLGRGPASFDLMAILGQAGDPTHDSTATWPEDQRRSTRLGTIALTAIEPPATCDTATFDPVAEIVDGVAGPADDPMFAIRSPAYAVSLSQRSN